MRGAFTVGVRDCLGPCCPMSSQCYYELARIRAEEADVIVHNHALLAFRLVLEGQIAEPCDAIVIEMI